MADAASARLRLNQTLPAGHERSFARQARGSVVLPGEDGYEAARIIWNAMVDRRPGLMIRLPGRR